MAETRGQREARLLAAANELARLRERRHSWEKATKAYMRQHKGTNPATMAAIERRARPVYETMRAVAFERRSRRAAETRARNRAAQTAATAAAIGAQQIIYPHGDRFAYPDDYEGAYVTFRHPSTGVPTTIEYWAPYSDDPSRSRLHEMAGGLLSTGELRQTRSEEFAEIYHQIVSGQATVVWLGRP